MAKSSTVGVDRMSVQLRLDRGVVEDIDATRTATARRLKRRSSRHAWIVRAIEERLEREKEAARG